MIKNARKLNTLKKGQIGILHRQWMWSDYIRQTYERLLKKAPKDVLFHPMRFCFHPVGCYMFLWYALLFSVLERSKEWNVEFDSVQTDIDTIYKPLRELRNAVFHPPVRYWDKRWYKLLETKDVGNKIREIHREIGETFIRIMKYSHS